MAMRSIRFNPAPALDKSAATTVHEWYQDRTGAFSAGFWASEPSEIEVSYDEDEFCVLIEGTVELTDATGHTETYEAGASFLIPSGFTGTWKSVTPVRKFYVVHLPKAPAAAPA
ncbi:cupin domain-containing protein [Xanthobacter dioxanivorans]|uniref:Cupin domain-containing protein n=1 Tax=Xanthobacter dioxanivorans TaxID=2528964 RepID=A0A974SHL6_9HYPH|nr:cupin domain-containing protein [Xanthobacter dioxanivorans]QRG06431.1 cupin domain-containing protein [Xanthobacter dioxanivorans]